MKRLNFYLFILGIWLKVSLCLAQDIPPVYSQFYLNPFVYNPANAGSDGYTSLYLAHRRQWMGIEGAPVTSSLSLHSPLSKTTAAGMLLSLDQTGVLQHMNAAVSFAYVIPLGREHNFRMGLSAGLSRQSMDLSKATPEQMAYLAEHVAEQNNFQARFGINYHYRNLNIGLASNNLSRAPGLSGHPTEKRLIDPLHDLVLNAIYHINLVPKQIQAEPYLIYHRFEESQRAEAGMLFYYKNFIWTGASFRSDYRVTTFFGVNLLNKVKLAYAYELGSAAISGLLHSTHEIQLAIKLGKERTFSKEIIRKPRFEL